MKTHRLKVATSVFDALVQGHQRHLVLRGVDVELGDRLVLDEHDSGSSLTLEGRLEAVVSYITPAKQQGIPEGVCAVSIQPSLVTNLDPTFSPADSRPFSGSLVE